MSQEQPHFQSKDSLKQESPKELLEKYLEKFEEKNKISFSQILMMHYCPYQHWQIYVLGGPRAKTPFTIFGTAVGVALEENLLKNNKQSWITLLKTIIKFIRTYEIEQKDLESSYFTKWCEKNKLEINEKNYRNYSIKNFCKSALRIYKDCISYFQNDLKDWDIIGFEIPLLEPIKDIDVNFIGYIDCILKHKTEDRYQILDFKTCSWGWDLETRKDTAKLYQVILYKKYWCEKNNIDTSKVDCSYLLLKRNPSAKETTSVELFEQTSGDRKLQNAEVWMLETLNKIYKGSRLKKKTTCNFCSCGAK